MEGVGTVRADGIVLDKDTLIPTIKGLLNGLTTEKLKELQDMDTQTIQKTLSEQMSGMTLPPIGDDVINQVKGFIKDILQNRGVTGGRKRKRRRTKRKRSKRKYSAKV